MFTRAQREWITVVCLVSVTVSPLWGHGGGNAGRGNAGGGGFRGGAGAAGGGAAAAGVAHKAGGAQAGGAPSAPRPNPGPASTPHAAGTGAIHSGSSVHPSQSVRGNQPVHGSDHMRGGEHLHAGGVGSNHLAGGGHGAPGFHGNIHQPGPHWNSYHQSFVGNHPVHLAHAGYRPSYYYHPWYHGPWGGHAWGWGWGFGPGVTFGLLGSGFAIGYASGWGYPSYYGPYGPYGYWGRPLGWGFGGWGLGTTAYYSGYNPYYNPYYVSAAYPVVVYDYSRPIVVAVQAPPGAPVALSDPNTPAPPLDNPAFDAARAAFRQGDYVTALANVDVAIKRTPTDAVMHEFRSLTLFAMRDYRQSAAVAHSVLAVGPGWDYTTMSSLYPDPFIYSEQLRNLEVYAQQHPRAADAHFLLAYHDMIGSKREPAIAELQHVVRLMPNDRLAGELLAMVQGPPKDQQLGNPPPESKRLYSGSSTPLPGDPNAVPGVPGAPVGSDLAQVPEIPPVDKSLLPGNWNASRDDGSKFRLTLTEDGKFIWKYSPPNQKAEEFGGNYTVEGPVLLLERKEGGALAGTATFRGDDKMNFKMVGSPTADKGLDFARF